MRIEKVRVLAMCYDARCAHCRSSFQPVVVETCESSDTKREQQLHQQQQQQRQPRVYTQFHMITMPKMYDFRSANRHLRSISAAMCRRVEYYHFHYELCTCISMLEPWEKRIASILLQQQQKKRAEIGWWRNHKRERGFIGFSHDRQLLNS